MKEIPDLNDYRYIEYYEDNKEINVRLSKLKFAHIFNDVNHNSFTEIFGLSSVKLVVSKLINTTSKEDNQVLVDFIKTNKFLNKSIVNM